MTICLRARRRYAYRRKHVASAFGNCVSRASEISEPSPVSSDLGTPFRCHEDERCCLRRSSEPPVASGHRRRVRLQAIFKYRLIERTLPPRGPMQRLRRPSGLAVDAGMRFESHRLVLLRNDSRDHPCLASSVSPQGGEADLLARVASAVAFPQVLDCEHRSQVRRQSRASVL